MTKKISFFIFGLFFLWIFWQYSKLVARSSYLRQMDFDLTVKIQNNIPKKLDIPLLYSISLASMETATIILVLVLIFQKKKRGILVLGFYGLGLGLALWGKTFVPHTPPAFMFHRLNQELPFSPYFAASENSYPSGHTYRIVFLFFVLASIFLRRNKKMFLLAMFTTVITILTGLVVLGHHWSSDVLGAIVLALSMVLFSRMLY